MESNQKIKRKKNDLAIEEYDKFLDYYYGDEINSETIRRKKERWNPSKR